MISKDKNQDNGALYFSALFIFTYLVKKKYNAKG